MAYTCEHCHKKRVFGHAVSHAKNRTRRAFAPNLQRLKVLKNGVSLQVRWCTSCIKRLKKDGRIGPFHEKKFAAVVVSPQLPKVVPVVEKAAKAAKTVKEKAKEKVKETLRIESIVGKKS